MIARPPPRHVGRNLPRVSPGRRGRHRAARPTLEDVDRSSSLRTTAGLDVGTLTLAPVATLLEGGEPTPTPDRVGATEIEQIRTAARVFTGWESAYGGGFARDAPSRNGSVGRSCGKPPPTPAPPTSTGSPRLSTHTSAPHRPPTPRLPQLRHPRHPRPHRQPHRQPLSTLDTATREPPGPSWRGPDAWVLSVRRVRQESRSGSPRQLPCRTRQQ